MLFVNMVLISSASSSFLSPLTLPVVLPPPFQLEVPTRSLAQARTTGVRCHMFLLADDYRMAAEAIYS